MGADSITDVFEALPQLIAEQGIEPKGIIHVGANRGQEARVYDEIGFETIRLVEPLPKLAQKLRDSGREVVEAAVSETPGKVTLHIPKWHQQASILMPRADKMPVVETVMVDCVRLDEIQDGCNVLVVDVQGAEVDVLRSGRLEDFEMIIVEVSKFTRYEGGALRDDILAEMKDWHLLAEHRHSSANVADCVFVPR